MCACPHVVSRRLSESHSDQSFGGAQPLMEDSWYTLVGGRCADTRVSAYRQHGELSKLLHWNVHFYENSGPRPLFRPFFRFSKFTGTSEGGWSTDKTSLFHALCPSFSRQVKLNWKIDHPYYPLQLSPVIALISFLHAFINEIFYSYRYFWIIMNWNEMLLCLNCLYFIEFLAILK